MAVKERLEAPHTIETVSDDDLWGWLAEWDEGKRSKTEIERTEFAKFSSNGKFITHVWRKRLGIETQKIGHAAQAAFSLAILAHQTRETKVWGPEFDKMIDEILKKYVR